MGAASRPETIGDLRASGYKVQTVKQELRRNLIRKIRADEELFPGIVGFHESVIPQLENAILAGQDLILLGERGQAKSRLIRHMVDLLDEAIPCIEGCELNDNPYDPICPECKEKVADSGDDVTISWVPREDRYAEKLATPDITVADLIGEIDPIKVAEGRYLSDELAIHYGLIPRTNRGIFSINELPDLSERIQVSLFNLMQERDVQIKGYRIMLPLDVMLVSSANPEDYTNRGRIITPLKDRYGAQIRTHYPRDIEEEIQIMEQEHTRFDDADDAVVVPQYMKEVIAEITSLARRSPEINQRSGVSLRVSIANYETVIGRAFKRSLRVKPEFALGRLLLREVYLAQGRRADAKRELRRIAESGLSAGAYVGMVRVGLVARGAMYLNKYLELSKVKQSDDPVLQQYGWLIRRINAEQSAGRDEPVQASESKTPTAN